MGTPKANWRWALAVLLLASGISRAAVQLKSAADLSGEIQKSEEQIKKAPPAARIDILKGLKTHLAEWIRKLPAKNADGPMRALRESLWAFDVYLKKIDTDKFEPKSCFEYRALVFMAFSPHSDSPEQVPGEAREALKILSIICQRPELAEIPVKGSPPASQD